MAWNLRRDHTLTALKIREHIQGLEQLTELRLLGGAHADEFQSKLLFILPSHGGQFDLDGDLMARVMKQEMEVRRPTEDQFPFDAAPCGREVHHEPLARQEITKEIRRELDLYALNLSVLHNDWMSGKARVPKDIVFSPKVYRPVVAPHSWYA